VTQPGRKEITRFGVSLEKELLDRFDGFTRDRGYGNRSEALRDLIREALREAVVARHRGRQAGVLTLLYDHHRPGLMSSLTTLFHEEASRTIASMHVHLDRDLCLEVIALAGRAANLQKLGNRVRAAKGVLLGNLFLLPVKP